MNGLEPLEGWFKLATLYLASGVEAAAAVVIAVACVQAFVLAAGAFVTRRSRSKEQVRLQLGRWLAVALEFELAADILRTAVAPTWNEIGQLAAIVVLRTVLNFFLQKEIASESARTARAVEARLTHADDELEPVH